MADHSQKAPRWDGEIPLKPLGWSALGLLALGVVAAIWMYTYQMSHQKKLAAQDPAAAPVARVVGDPRSGPKLQMNPDLDLGAMRAHNDQVLSTWGWVDQQKGIVRMPIADAVAWVGEHGVDAASRMVSSAPAPVVAATEVDPAAIAAVADSAVAEGVAQ